MKLHVITHGTPSDGLSLIGPFESKDAKSHSLLVELRHMIRDINVDQHSTPLVNTLMDCYGIGAKLRTASLRSVLRLCADDRMLAQQFQADARVWKVLTVLSRSIVPATELNSALLEHRGPISKWLAVHANVEHGGFTVYEKVNDCDAEAGYERGIARHDTYESAISDIYDRALVSSLQEVAPDCGNF